ncbi:hypothetical protein ACLOJK_023801 [Asimina triloba]
MKEMKEMKEMNRAPSVPNGFGLISMPVFVRLLLLSARRRRQRLVIFSGQILRSLASAISSSLSSSARRFLRTDSPVVLSTPPLLDLRQRVHANFVGNTFSF